MSRELVLQVEGTCIIGLLLVDVSLGDLHTELGVTKRDQLAAFVVSKVIVKYECPLNFYFNLHIQLWSNSSDFMGFAGNVESSVASGFGLSNEVVQREGVMVIQFYLLKINVK